MRKYLLFLLLLFACRQKVSTHRTDYSQSDTNLFREFADPASPAQSDSSLPEKIVAFARTLTGVTYKYCSMTPEGGFDCSGFVNYVFNHFNIKVPRASVDFTDIGEHIALSDARPGDLVLFTGTNPRKRVVGHIGIVTANDNGNINFIHSTSGTANGVTISPLDNYYMSRFVKVIRIVK